MKTTLANDRKEALARRRASHHAALETLRHPSCKLTGLQIWRKLRKLENLANAGATAYCNGEDFQAPSGSVYRFRTGENAWEDFTQVMHGKIASVFGSQPAGRFPEGVFINGDPRGHALKLNSEKVKIPDGMQTDWGRDGILAPVID